MSDLICLPLVDYGPVQVSRRVDSRRGWSLAITSKWTDATPSFLGLAAHAAPAHHRAAQTSSAGPSLAWESRRFRIGVGVCGEKNGSVPETGHVSHCRQGPSDTNSTPSQPPWPPPHHPSTTTATTTRSSPASSKGQGYSRWMPTWRRFYEQILLQSLAAHVHFCKKRLCSWLHGVALCGV